MIVLVLLDWSWVRAEAAGKLGEFLELCESGGLPIVSLCDTPGFMVGPEVEKDATVKRFGELFVIGARLSVPFGAVVLRKGYGLGAMAMTSGSFKTPQFTVAWPTGEIGGMGSKERSAWDTARNSRPRPTRQRASCATTSWSGRPTSAAER